MSQFLNLLRKFVILFSLLFCINSTYSQNMKELQHAINEAAGDRLKLLDAYFEFGKYLAEAGNSESSIEQVEKAVQIASDIHHDAKVATIANYLANMYAGIGDFKASNDAYKIALESAKRIDNIGDIAKISMNLAANYNFLGNYEEAIQHGLFALKTKETYNNLERICYHYIAMGNIFRENNNHVKWEEYVQKAYKMKDIEGCASFSDIAKIYNSLGGIAVQKEAFGSALLFYDTLMILSMDANFEQGISTALTNSAGVYKQLNDYPKALELATASEKYFGNNPYEPIFNNNFKADLYNLSGEFKKGLALVKKNIEIKEINSYSTEKLKCLELLYQLNFNLNNYEEAFFWNDSLRHTERILRDEDIRKSIEDLEAKYETEKKEQKIELLTAENKIKSQQNRISLLFVMALLVILTLGVFVFLLRKKQAAFKQAELQQQLLRSQMKPHFIFNVLGSIQSYMRKNEAKKAAQYLTAFASLSRSVLEFSSMESITLTEEIEMLKNYVELENMKSGHQFDFIFKMDDQIESDFIKIPPMMVQVFVENAIKHGLSNIDYTGILKLEIYEIDGYIEFVVEDNGVGIRAEISNYSAHKSRAMEIFNQRKKLIEQRCKKKLKFELINLHDLNSDLTGVKVNIHLPILNYD